MDVFDFCFIKRDGRGTLRTNSVYRLLLYACKRVYNARVRANDERDDGDGVERVKGRLKIYMYVYTENKLLGEFRSRRDTFPIRNSSRRIVESYPAYVLGREWKRFTDSATHSTRYDTRVQYIVYGTDRV